MATGRPKLVQVVVTTLENESILIPPMWRFYRGDSYCKSDCVSLYFPPSIRSVWVAENSSDLIQEKYKLWALYFSQDTARRSCFFLFNTPGGFYIVWFFHNSCKECKQSRVWGHIWIPRLRHSHSRLSKMRTVTSICQIPNLQQVHRLHSFPYNTLIRWPLCMNDKPDLEELDSLSRWAPPIFVCHPKPFLHWSFYCLRIGPDRK